MARKKIREYDSKRLLKEHLKQITGIRLEKRKKENDDGGVEDGKKWS